MTQLADSVRQIGSLLDARDWTSLRALLSDEFVDHSAPPGAPAGPDGYVATLRWVTEQLGITYQVEDVVADGNTAALRATASGVDEHGGFGFPATGKPFSMATMHWYRGGEHGLTEHWGVLDQLGMLTQIGAVPPPH